MRSSSIETNIGLQLDRMIRTGACGTWWSATTPTGYPLGVLQLDPELVATPPALDRLATVVAATRTVSSPGVLRTSELVVDRGRAWLVVAHAPAPTIADLLGEGIPLEPGRAAGIAVDLADGLRDLHAVGLGHGNLGPDTAILTPAGGALLTEVGVLAAIRAVPVDVSQDSAAWAALARRLAELAPGAEAHALRASAAVAELGDLATAVRRLRVAATALSQPAEHAADLAELRGRAFETEAIAVPTQSTMEPTGARVRLRFGPGVPEPVAGRAPAATGRSRRSAGPGRPGGRGRRPGVSGDRSLRAIQTTVALLAVALLAGAALWGVVLLRWS